ncbi:MAG: Uma2 family endonuclease [bacterium]|nr:Uma2 family endonuclease [bacterium]
MIITRVSLEEFERFIDRPENADRRFEWIGGEIVEVPSNPYSSEIASLIAFFMRLFLHQHGLKGHVTGEGGGYTVMGERYAPDAAYISAERQQALPYTEGHNPFPPQLAVEVVSPSDRVPKLLRKVGNYLAAGTVVWVVYPIEQEVEVYVPNQPVRIFGMQDTLDGGNVLPDFRLAVREIFPPREGA